MDLKQDHFHAMIYYGFKSGLKERQCLRRLQAAFGDLCPSQATVFCWFAEFKRGRSSFADEDHLGWPATATSPDLVAIVEQMLREDPCCIYSQIQSALNIGSAAVKTILSEKLNVRKLCSCWIPHRLTMEQKGARVSWCKKMLEEFDGGHLKNIYNIITGDENWIYQYDPKTKRQSSVSIFPGQNTPTKVRDLGA